MVEEDTNPAEQHGFTSVCECGYVFHKDKWHLVDDVTIEFKKLFHATLSVSTVFLELNHFGYWYETMIFADVRIPWFLRFLLKPLECDYQKRYVTKEEAETEHEDIVKKLREGKFKIKTVWRMLFIVDRYELELNSF